jgi:hypothetical protein
MVRERATRGTQKRDSLLKLKSFSDFRSHVVGKRAAKPGRLATGFAGLSGCEVAQRARQQADKFAWRPGRRRDQQAAEAKSTAKTWISDSALDRAFGVGGDARTNRHAEPART